MRVQLLTVCLLILGISPNWAGEFQRKYKALTWEWKKEEIKELKELAKETTKNSDGSYVLEMPNWRVRTWHTPLFTAQAGKYMEMFSEVFYKAFMLKGERGFKDFKPELRIYSNREEYIKKSGAPAWSEGICKTRWQIVDDVVTPEISLHTYFIFCPAGKREPVFGSGVPLGTIQHEGTHCLLQCLYGSMPIPYWLNEGAASYYEAWPLRKKITDEGESKKDAEARGMRRSFSPGPLELRMYYKKYPRDSLPPLDKLLAANTNEAFYCDNGGPLTALNYNLAESFFDFLMGSRKRRPFMLRILERVRDQKGVSSADSPFVTVEEVMEYEKDWLKFLMENWGVKFSPDRIKARAKELKERAAAAKKSRK